MPGIDLVADTPAVAGGYIADFGQSVANLGAALFDKAQTNQQTYSAEQQALLDTETAKQVIQAKGLAYAAFNEFNQGLDTNMDYAGYSKAWTDFKAGLDDRLSTVLTLPSAKQKFAEWYVPENDKQADYVYGETRKKTVAAAQATVVVTADQLALAGNEEGLKDLAKTAVASGVYSAGEVSTMLSKSLPEAHYNAVTSYLLKNYSLDEALAQLATDSAGQFFNVDSATLKKLTEDFQYRKDAQKKAQDAIDEKTGEENYQKFLTKLQDGSFKSLNELESYVNLVGKNHSATVQAEVDRQKSNALNSVALNQDNTRDWLNKQASDWALSAPDAKAPFTRENLDALVAKGEIRAEQADEAWATYQNAQKNKDDPEYSWMVSRLYSAKDAKTNPGLAVSIKDIDDTIQDATKHKELLALRNSLVNDWESKAGNTKKAMWLEGYNVVYSKTMTVKQKNDWIDATYRAGDLSFDDATKLRGKVRPDNDDPDRANVFDALQSAYKTSMANPNATTATVNKLQWELFKAQQDMEAVILANPENKTIWQEQLRKILEGKAVDDLTTLVRQAAGVDVTGFATGEVRPAYREATILEYLRENNQAPVGSVTQNVLTKARQLETDAFKKAGMGEQMKFSVVMGNDVIYSDKAIQKGASGKYLASPNNYMVRYQIKDGKYVPTIYKQNMDTGAFDIIAWEWK